LRSLLEFINEPWSDDVLKYYQQPHDLGRGDRKALLQKGIVPSIDNWRALDEVLLEKVQAIVQQPAARLGYTFDAREDRKPSDFAEVTSEDRAW
jgi:hypothetical protein